MKFLRRRTESDEFETAAEREPPVEPVDDDDLDDGAFARAIAEGREREQQYPQSA